MTFEELQKYTMMIMHVMKDLEFQGQENVQQSQVIDKMVHKLEVESHENSTSLEKSMETSRKVANVIQYLIQNEGFLLITQDAKTKNERYISLNPQITIENVPGALRGSGEAVN